MDRVQRLLAVALHAAGEWEACFEALTTVEQTLSARGDYFEAALPFFDFEPISADAENCPLVRPYTPLFSST